MNFEYIVGKKINLEKYAALAAKVGIEPIVVGFNCIDAYLQKYNISLCDVDGVVSEHSFGRLEMMIRNGSVAVIEPTPEVVETPVTEVAETPAEIITETPAEPAVAEPTPIPCRYKDLDWNKYKGSGKAWIARVDSGTHEFLTPIRTGSYDRYSGWKRFEIPLILGAEYRVRCEGSKSSDREWRWKVELVDGELKLVTQ